MHDPTSIYRFEEHDIFLPMVTLEELDSNKKGMSEVARNARQASRFIEELICDKEHTLHEGVPLIDASQGQASGRLFLQTEATTSTLPSQLPMGKADNQILGVLHHLHQLQPRRQVILVSKDINMRIKARALGMAAEDYFNDKVLEDTDLLYTACAKSTRTFGSATARDMKSWQESGRSYWRLDPARIAVSSISTSCCSRMASRRSWLALFRPRENRTTGKPEGLHPPQKRGGSWRAIVNRISLSTC